jgi:hypothetical protein
MQPRCHDSLQSYTAGPFIFIIGILLYNSMIPYTCLCKTTIYVLVSSFDYRFSSEYKKSKQPGKLLLEFFFKLPSSPKSFITTKF